MCSRWTLGGGQYAVKVAEVRTSDRRFLYPVPMESSEMLRDAHWLDGRRSFSTKTVVAAELGKGFTQNRGR